MRLSVGDVLGERFGRLQELTILLLAIVLNSILFLQATISYLLRLCTICFRFARSGSDRSLSKSILVGPATLTDSDAFMFATLSFFSALSVVSREGQIKATDNG